jgi:hypothetical protein
MWFLATWFFGGLGYQGPQTTHFTETSDFGPCRIQRQGQQTICFWNMCGALALVPQASKTTLGQNATSGSL